MSDQAKPFYFDSNDSHVTVEQCYFLGMTMYRMPFTGHCMLAVTDDFGQAVQVDSHVEEIVRQVGGC